MTKGSRVAIVGRPNVGKSTLFNRITGRRSAIVHPAPGVTRDVQRTVAEWNGRRFELVDTGGLFAGIDDDLIRQVEKRAIDETTSSDVILFVADAEAGVTPTDADIARHLRETKAPILVVVNKTESDRNKHAAAGFYELGFDRVFSVSALHGYGVGDVLDAVTELLPGDAAAPAEAALRVALVGRPNVGKSSIANAILGTDASIVDSRPGTTRDSVDLALRWHGRDMILVDTAGVAKRGRKQDGLISLTAIKSIDAVKRADVAIIVLDADREIANQDVKVAAYAHKAAKGIVLVVNKWDLVEDKDNESVPNLEREIRRKLKFISYAPIIFISAKTGQRLHRIFETAWDIQQRRLMRLPTSEVNALLESSVAAHPPPFYRGGTGKVYYATQAEVLPPTFVLFVNRRVHFSRAYVRYLNNQIRSQHDFTGTLIRLKLVEKERKEESA